MQFIVAIVAQRVKVQYNIMIWKKWSHSRQQETFFPECHNALHSQSLMDALLQRASSKTDADWTAGKNLVCESRKSCDQNAVNVKWSQHTWHGVSVND